MTGKNSVAADVGETVRLFVGNGGPNLVSSFHVIGEIFDKVYVEGGQLINENVQTTLVPAGGAAIVKFKVDVPGEFIMVDHSIFRAFNKGALGILEVGGKPDSAVPKAKNKEEQILFGQRVYEQNCQACHQANGQGIKNAFPPLAGSDYLLSDPRWFLCAFI